LPKPGRARFASLRIFSTAHGKRVKLWRMSRLEGSGDRARSGFASRCGIVNPYDR